MTGKLVEVNYNPYGKNHKVTLCRLGLSDTVFVDSEGYLFLRESAPSGPGRDVFYDGDGFRYDVSQISLPENRRKSLNYVLNRTLIEKGSAEAKQAAKIPEEVGGKL